ncbi:hypothetical protein [Candidatus Sodalis pierantonius]|uniref:hypothetical protein n=1 Tax=Candidatus Sodalis pierantonii TaxID=1486991 RepID=UPI00046CC2FE|nr:hypothetical protein [Candidatus Sodalis pierantonius]
MTGTLAGLLARLHQQRRSGYPLNLQARYARYWQTSDPAHTGLAEATQAVFAPASADGPAADSDVSDQLFRRHPISYSDIFRSPIPVIFDHVFAHLLTRV